MPRKLHLTKQKEEDDGPLAEDDLRLYHGVWREQTQVLVHDGANSKPTSTRSLG